MFSQIREVVNLEKHPHFFCKKEIGIFYESKVI